MRPCRVFLGIAVGVLLLSVLVDSGCSSDKTAWVNRKWLDEPYATQSGAQKLDVYLPNEGVGPFPVIVAVHGGAFLMGDKANGGVGEALEGLKRGFAVAAVNYRLSAEAKFPAQIRDVKAAIRFLRANAVRFSLNPDKVAVWGASAGGYLAAMAGTSGDVAEMEDKDMGNPGQSSRVQAVVDWFGPINFLTMDAQNSKSGMADKISGVMGHGGADSPESKLLADGRALLDMPNLVKAANPETYITPDDPPFFIQHGTLDPMVPTGQSVDFAARLVATLGKDRVTLDLLEGAGHGSSHFSTPKNVKKALDFLAGHLQ